MKTLLVLTDCSKKDENVVKASVLFSGKLKKNIQFVNAYLHYAMIPSYEGSSLIESSVSFAKAESEDQLNELAEHMGIYINKLTAVDYIPTISVQSAVGPLGQITREIIKEKNVSMIFMGPPKDSRLDHILFGSDVEAVLDVSDIPVVIVPEKAPVEKINKIFFATDFDDTDISAIKYLVKVAKLFDCELEIVHINLIGRGEPSKSINELSFEKKRAKIKYPKMTYHEVRGKDVIHRLNSLCHKDGADLLAMVQDKHSVFTSIFKEGTVQKALSVRDFPVMIFPAKMF